MDIRNLSITTDEAEIALIICSGENSIDLSKVNKDNWITERNRFLTNVRYNGGNSHYDIINVLIWFNRFCTDRYTGFITQDLSQENPNEKNPVPMTDHHIIDNDF